MEGIYLTEQGKKELEVKIAELRVFSPLEAEDDFINRGKQIAFEEILSNPKILPVEESRGDILIVLCRRCGVGDTNNDWGCTNVKCKMYPFR